MKKVLVTGAGGFIGSHLCERLLGLGYSVRAFVRYNSRSSWGWIDGMRDKLDVVAGDLRDFDSVSEAVRGMDEVFHLGALIGIPYSYVSPLAYIKTNVEGTYNVLEASRRNGISKVLVTSTSEVYGTARKVPIEESHPLQPQSPYAASKIGADQLALSYYHSFRLPVVIARPFNTYGPRQSARAIVPSVMVQLLGGVSELKLGSLAPTRDLTFVADTVRGMCEISACSAFVGRVVNIGSGQEISVGDLAHLIMDVVGKRVPIVQEGARVRPPASEVERLLGSSDVLRIATAWSPSVSLREGIAVTSRWIEENLQQYKSDLYNV